MSVFSQALIASYKSSGTPPPPTKSMSFVSSTVAKYDTAMQIGEVIPTVGNNDGLFAFVMSRSDLMIPTGWTEITHVDCANNAVMMQRLTLMRKNTVLATDTGQGVQISQVGSGRIGINLFSFRSSTASFEISQFLSNNFNNVESNSYRITPPSLTALTDKEIFVIGGTTVLGNNDEPNTPSTLSDFNLTSGGPPANRLNSQYKVCDKDFVSSGSYEMVIGSSDTNNGLASIIVRIKAI